MEILRSWMLAFIFISFELVASIFDLDAFGHNPADNGFALLASQLTALPDI